MVNYFIFVYGLVSFFTVLFFTPKFVIYLKKIGLIVKDQNKDGKPLVPISGGLIVFVGIMAGLLLFIFYRVFFNDGKGGLHLGSLNLMLIFAAIVSLFIITLIGFLDDLVIKSNKDASLGLKQWQKPLLTLAAAIPLMAVKAGVTDVSLPFFGTVELGLLYPLLLIPIGVVGAANMVNMLAGFNGLETGMGIVYTGMLGLYAYANGRQVAALIALVTLGALIGFYYYNRFPAKILPGDSLTYLLGAIIAIIAILGNIERAALIASIPFFIEFILKLRGKFKFQTYGYFKDGKICSLYQKVYSIPHLLTRTGKFTEKQITYSMIILELIFCMLIWVV